MKSYVITNEQELGICHPPEDVLGLPLDPEQERKRDTSRCLLKLHVHLSLTTV